MIASRSLEFSSHDQSINAYLAHPVGGGPGVIVLHAWWGLTPFFKNFCDRLALQGFTALAPDLHAGKTTAVIEEAQQLLDYTTYDFKQAAVLGALEQIRSLAGVEAKPIGVIGFSMGAAYALLLSTLAPENAKAVVLFYGSYPIEFDKSQATYLGHFAEHDDWEPIEDVQQTLAAIRSAGLQAEFHFYPGAGHWFFEDNRPDAFQPEAAALAWQRTLDFLRENLTNPA